MNLCIEFNGYCQTKKKCNGCEIEWKFIVCPINFYTHPITYGSNAPFNYSLQLESAHSPQTSLFPFWIWPFWRENSFIHSTCKSTPDVGQIQESLVKIDWFTQCWWVEGRGQVAPRKQYVPLGNHVQLTENYSYY